jgi:hypothetical protein
MASFSQVNPDLASCDPGSPMVVAEKDVATGVSLFHNPAGDVIHLTHTDHPGVPANLRMINSIGVMVLEKNSVSGNISLNLTWFPTGIYFLESW